jgi:Fe-S cluster biogenesis protein NfuA/nitrite reductase/ring-hydroxylating ferredoxin subunit
LIVRWTDEQARERVAALEARLEQLDGAALQAVAGVVEVYGEALGRIVDALAADAVTDLAADELVGQLLLIHDLSPSPVQARVAAALDEVRPYLASHGGGVELVAIEDATVRLRLEGHCSGCPSSTATLELAVKDAIRAAAPEIERVVADGAAAEPVLGVPLPMAPPAASAAVWSVVGELPEPADGRPLVRDVAGEEVLFARVGGDLYAYRPACPACGASLVTATLDDAELVCGDCGNRYDIVAAGRGVDDPAVHLDPLPLLVAGGQVKIAHREAVAR